MIRVESRASRNLTLRSLDTQAINCCEELKWEIRNQFEEDVTGRDFDVVYVQGTKVILIRSRLDV